MRVTDERAPEVPVRFYRSATGREPVLEWLRSLDRQDRQAIGLDLMRVQFGWPIGMPLVRSLKDGLWEVRSHLPSRNHSSTDTLLSPEDVGRAARIHQEDTEDATRGSRIGETEMEGGYALRKRNKHVGASLDEFLKEEGILAETRAVALKDAIAWQVQQTMQKEKITKVEMARRMRTSRAALDRLLAPGNASVTLQTLTRAARAVGRDLRIELV